LAQKHLTRLRLGLGLRLDFRLGLELVPATVVPATVVTQPYLPRFVFARHTLSRLTAPMLIKTRDYVDEQGPKYKFYSFFVEAKHLVTWGRVCFAVATSFAVACLAYGAETASVLIGCVVLAVLVSGRYAEYLLGGVMGDYLGATICVTEVFLLTALAMLRQVGRYRELVAGLALQASQVAQGSLTLQALLDDVLQDNRKLSLLRFACVGIFTWVWCSCVGHPPVFVRTSVAAKGETEETQISLTEDYNSKEEAQGGAPKKTKTKKT
jgi:hypothetical protein